MIRQLNRSPGQRKDLNVVKVSVSSVPVERHLVRAQAPSRIGFASGERTLLGG